MRARLDPLGVDPLLQFADSVEAGLLLLPPGLQGAELLLQVGEVSTQFRQSLFGRLVGFTLERHLLHAQPIDLSLQLVDLDRARVDLHAKSGRCLVNEVDRLVGQLARGDVPMRERGGRDERGVLDLHLVVRFVALLQPTQNGDRVLDTRLTDEHLLKAALESRVLLDVLAELVERGRADHAQLTARQHRLEHVAGIHR